MSDTDLTHPLVGGLNGDDPAVVEVDGANDEAAVLAAVKAMLKAAKDASGSTDKDKDFKLPSQRPPLTSDSLFVKGAFLMQFRSFAEFRAYRNFMELMVDYCNTAQTWISILCATVITSLAVVQTAMDDSSDPTTVLGSSGSGHNGRSKAVAALSLTQTMMGILSAVLITIVAKVIADIRKKDLERIEAIYMANNGKLLVDLLGWYPQPETPAEIVKARKAADFSLLWHASTDIFGLVVAPFQWCAGSGLSYPKLKDRNLSQEHEQISWLQHFSSPQELFAEVLAWRSREIRCEDAATYSQVINAMLLTTLATLETAMSAYVDSKEDLAWRFSVARLSVGIALGIVGIASVPRRDSADQLDEFAKSFPDLEFIRLKAKVWK